MSKILKNTTASDILIGDVGLTISANSTYNTEPTDGLLWAASDELITHLGTGDLVGNDGTSDLSPSESTKLFQGLYPSTVSLDGATYTNGALDVNASITTGATTFADNGIIDSFGRLRVSNISNIFESTHVNSEQIEFWDKSTTGGATVVYDAARAEIHLNVGTASGDRAIRQTFNYFHYAAGQSMIIRFTGVLGSGKANVNSYMGYMDDDNGIFFANRGGDFGVCIRSDVSGSVVDNLVLQSNFNIDKLDGTGPSGITIDLDKTHIFQVEYQWLGVGSVKLSMNIDGKQYYIHKYNHANIETQVYMRTPHLPVRYEIKNTEVSASATTLTQICTQVANEGKSIVGDLINVIDNGTTTKAISNSTFKPILSYRHKRESKILTEIINIANMVTTADDVLIEIYVDATLTGALWTSHSQFIEFDSSATAISGGRKVASFYVSKESSSPSGSFKSKFRLGSYIDGTPQHITICAKSFSNSAAMVSAITFKELF